MEHEKNCADLSEESKRSLAREFHRDLVEWQMEVYRVAFKNTGNPVYVWKALRWLSPILQQIRINLGEDLPPGPGSPPAWCMEYLLNCADAIDKLTFGFDPRDLEYTELTEGQRIDILPALLGFARPGWNAFSRYRSIEEMHYISKYLNELRDEGVSNSAALSKAAEHYGFEDERSLRRRLAKRRAVFADTAEDKPEEGQT
jgi:hypothetical protein